MPDRSRQESNMSLGRNQWQCWDQQRKRRLELRWLIEPSSWCLVMLYASNSFIDQSLSDFMEWSRHCSWCWTMAELKYTPLEEIDKVGQPVILCYDSFMKNNALTRWQIACHSWPWLRPQIGHQMYLWGKVINAGQMINLCSSRLHLCSMRFPRHIRSGIEKSVWRILSGCW